MAETVLGDLEAPISTRFIAMISAQIRSSGHLAQICPSRRSAPAEDLPQPTAKGLAQQSGLSPRPRYRSGLSAIVFCSPIRGQMSYLFQPAESYPFPANPSSTKKRNQVAAKLGRATGRCAFVSSILRSRRSVVSIISASGTTNCHGTRFRNVSARASPLVSPLPQFLTSLGLPSAGPTITLLIHAWPSRSRGVHRRASLRFPFD